MFKTVAPSGLALVRKKKFTVLMWLVGEAAAADGLNGKVLEKKDVETKPELLHCGL